MQRARNLICAPVIGPFILHLAYAAWFEATRSGSVCRPWLVLGTNGVLYTPALLCDFNDSLSVISLCTGEIIHDSHDLVAKTRDAETAKSCGSCTRALWSNVRGYIEIASSSGSVREARLRFTYKLRRGYLRFLLEHTRAVQ
jgi:hypothetical protein